MFDAKFITVTLTKNNDFEICMDDKVFCVIKYTPWLYGHLYKVITRRVEIVLSLHDDKQLEIQRSGHCYDFKFLNEDNRIVKISEYEFVEFCKGIIESSRFLDEDGIAIPYELTDALDTVLIWYEEERS